MMLLDLLLRPALVSAILLSGPNRCGPVSTSGGKEMARGIKREDTLAVVLRVKTEKKKNRCRVRETGRGGGGGVVVVGSKDGWSNASRLGAVDRRAGATGPRDCRCRRRNEIQRLNGIKGIQKDE